MICEAYSFKETYGTSWRGGHLFLRTRCTRPATEVTEDGVHLCRQHYKAAINHAQKNREPLQTIHGECYG